MVKHVVDETKLDKKSKQLLKGLPRGDVELACACSFKI